MPSVSAGSTIRAKGWVRRRQLVTIRLDPGPEAEHRAGAAIGGEIGDDAAGREDDVIDHSGRIGRAVGQDRIDPGALRSAAARGAR